MKNFRLILFGAIAIALVASVSCKDKLDNTTYFTTSTLTLAERLELSPDTFSAYIEVLKKTGYFNAFKSYGSYTCFAPTNEAILKYIKAKWGVSSVSELNSQEQIDALKLIVKFHTMPTRKLTTAFKEGRLADTTFTGDFLTTTFAAGGGIQNVMVNKTAKILTPADIIVDNGVIQVLNQVMEPFVDPVPVVMEKTGKFNIFVEALKKTGYYTTFSTIYSSGKSRAYYTVIAESDSVYKLSNINSFADLANRLSPGQVDYTNISNPLNRFIAYHATTSFLYSSDLPSDGFVSTILANNAIKVLKSGNFLKINETETGENDTWLSLIIPQSNYPTRNGVFHTVNKYMDIFIPRAKYIIFDVVSDQPEVQSKAIAKLLTVPSGTYQYISWYPETNMYRWNSASSNTNLNYDIFDVGSFVWMEFITPVIPKGKYEFLCCANGGNNARGIFQIYWDGEPIGSTWDVRTKGTSVSGWPDDSAAMEAAGWRHGLKRILNAAGASQYDNTGQMRKVITRELLCPVQQKHVIRLETVKSGGVPLDYFEFIPVN